VRHASDIALQQHMFACQCMGIIGTHTHTSYAHGDGRDMGMMGTRTADTNT